MTDSDEESEQPRRDARDEPLGDLAERVREETGQRRGSEGDSWDSKGEHRESAEPTRREGPLADVASEVDERRRRSHNEASDPFESVDVGELDGEKLWDELATGGTEATSSVATEQAVAAETVSAEVTDDAGSGRDVRTIPKETCHGCPHLGDPPELHCTHEGTDILAMPDTDHFRVADCPMVVDGEEDIGGIVGNDELGDGTTTRDDVQDGATDGEETTDGVSD